MSSRPKICLIYTGGTIGMRRRPTGQGGYVLCPPDDAENFLRHLQVEAEVAALAEVDFVELMNKDSSNIVPEDWTRMAVAVYERLDCGYAGFVIVHGTDTLHFSASALAFAFGKNLNHPIVFTGAQTTAEVVYGDARVNLLRAVKVACEDLAEVVVVFGDAIFRGCRVQKKDERRFDAFVSPAEPPLGYVTEYILLNKTARKKDAQRPPVQFEPHFSDGILQIGITPGLRPAMLGALLQHQDCRGVMLQGFGAGNIPDEGVYAWQEFIVLATALQKPVLLVSPFAANATLHSRYAPGLAAIEAGAIAIGNMTHAAAAVKFSWALYQVHRLIEQGRLKSAQMIGHVRAMMQTIHVGEMDETPLGIR
ncbi:MAG: asparaginase [Methylococcaceae bacterium]|nr:MAG: asparaginase [Methylococcaceae bacterium]